jgi:MFS family permease
MITLKRRKVAVPVVAMALALSACNQTAEGERAGAGALIGGATGAVVGGLATGRVGGAVAGGAIGAAGGAIIGAATTPRRGTRVYREQCYYDRYYGQTVCE